MKIGRYPIRNVHDLNRATKTLTHGHQFIMQVQRGRKIYNVVMRN